MWRTNKKTQTKTGKILFVHIVLVQKSNITNLHAILKSHFPATILTPWQFVISQQSFKSWLCSISAQVVHHECWTLSLTSYREQRRQQAAGLHVDWKQLCVLAPEHDGKENLDEEEERSKKKEKLLFHLVTYRLVAGNTAQNVMTKLFHQTCKWDRWSECSHTWQHSLKYSKYNYVHFTSTFYFYFSSGW